MTILTMVLLGLAMGAIMGGLGGGGAILTVPALVYVVGQPVQQATTSSLVIVGLTAIVGMASYVPSGRVWWKIALGFGVAGVPAAVAGSRLNAQVDQSHLLIGFSALMVVAALAMVFGGDRTGDAAERQRGRRSPEATGARRGAAARSQPSWPGILAAGLAVGFLTGFFGVGGGFVIVPVLVLLLGLPMQDAVGTSLLIIAMNSATSLAARVGVADFDWSVIVPFTLAAMAATIAGKHVADRLPARRLQLAFAGLLVIVAGYTAWQSIDTLTGPATSTAMTCRSTSVTPATLASARLTATCAPAIPYG